MEVVQIGNILPTKTRDNPNQGRVYDCNGLCPTLTNMQGGNRQPMILETVRIKQANKQGYIDCEVGGVADFSYPSSTTRRGRVQDRGNTCPAITVEGAEQICRIEKEVTNEERYKDITEVLRILRKENGEEAFCEWSIRGLWCILQAEVLRQNMYAKSIYENWTYEPKLVEFAYNGKNNQFPDYSEESVRDMWEEWKTRCTPQRRGLSEQQCRQLDNFMQKLPYEATQRKGFVCCLWEAGQGIRILQQALSQIQEIWQSNEGWQMQRNSYRIRKLTPLETWRLQAFTDEDFHKAEAVNSNTQLYKESGNSICVAVLMAIFSQLHIIGVPVWNDLTEEERIKWIEETTMKGAEHGNQSNE